MIGEAMTLTLEITPEVKKACEGKAQRAGVPPAAYAAHVLANDAAGEEAASVTASPVRGKHTLPARNTVDEFVAERHAEGLAEDAA
jgi:hypothetical protein